MLLKQAEPDAASLLIHKILPKTIEYLNSGAREYKPPIWVTELQENPKEIRIHGKEGANLLDEWRTQTEAEIEAIFKDPEWGLVRTLGMLRRLPIDYFFLGERSQEGALRSFDPYLANVAEWAVLKHSAWDSRRTKLEAWAEGPSGFGFDVPEINRESLAQIMALTRLAGPQFGHLDNVRKTLARGGEAIQRLDGNIDARQPPELMRRFDLYDRRTARFSSYGSTAGTFRSHRMPSDPLGSVHYFRRAPCREDEGENQWRYERLERWIPKSEKRFLMSEIPLRPLYEYLHLLEDVVVERYGITPEVIVATLMSLEKCIWFFLCAGFNHSELKADRLIHLDRVGYLLIGDEIMDTAVLGELAYKAHERAFARVQRDSESRKYFAHGFKNLAYLDSYRAEDISLGDGHPWTLQLGYMQSTPMPKPFIYPAGPSVRLVDLHALGDFVRGLYDCLFPPDKPSKRVSTDLEFRLDEYFGEELDHRRAFPSGTKLWHEKGGRKERVAELDVSFKIGDVLVIVDAKSIVLSPGYRRYQYGALKTRWEKFAGKGDRKGYVGKADEQAEKLARHPRGTNYDLLADGYTYIVTLLCSTLPEYLNTDDPSFFVKGDLPRVATPPELRSYLAEVAAEELKEEIRDAQVKPRYKPRDP